MQTTHTRQWIIATEGFVECKHLIARVTCGWCMHVKVDGAMMRELEGWTRSRHELLGTGGLEMRWGPWQDSEYSGRCHCCGEPYDFGDRVRFSAEDDGYVCAPCGKEGDAQRGEIFGELSLKQIARREKLGAGPDE